MPAKRKQASQPSGSSQSKGKKSRVASDSTSSQTGLPSASQNPRDSWAGPPPVSFSSSQHVPSSQSFGGFEDDLPIDLTQEDDPQIELYGSTNNKIVGVRWYYNGLVTPGELVIFRREPQNPYDRNAIRVDNVMGRQIGHIPRKLAEQLAPYIDAGDLILEGVLTGEKGEFDCPIRIYLYGTSDVSGRAALETRLKNDRLLKVTDMKTTRKEAEARRKLGLQSGTSSQGLGSSQEQQQQPSELSLEQLVAVSQTVNTTRADDFATSLSTSEEDLEKMPKAQQPEALKSQLLPYQLQGLAWMLEKEKPQLPASGSDDVVQLWKRKNNQFLNLGSGFRSATEPKLLSGGILADDMGLGKTVQTISLILAQVGEGPTLIIAPVSVLGNWEGQIQYHVKETHQPRVFVYHSGKSATAAELRKYDVVITSYGLVSSEMRANNNSRLHGVEWRRVILDEGHIIRNPKSQGAQAVWHLKAKSRWVLTGTPIINNVRDFLSLLKFLRLGGGLEDEGLFAQVITRPLKSSPQGAPDRDRAVKILGYLMRDLCLRRRKDMKFVDLKLPPKTMYVHRIAFGSDEQKKYNALLSEAQGELERFQAQSTKGQKGRFTNVLERLLRLRQICNHWALCKERVQDLLDLFDDGKLVALDKENVEILQKALDLMVESQEECAICYEPIGMHEPVITACKHVFGKPCISRAIELQGKCPMCRNELKPDLLVDAAVEILDEETVDSSTTKSAKTEAMLGIVQGVLKDPGSKVVIFSQWTSFLNIIQARLDEVNIATTRVDGSMLKENRDAALTKFDSNPETRILLASLGVCSVGLNLVAADTVILMDSWWAPAIEDQAVDRVHRLGQKRATTVWRLVIEGSVEERVLDIQDEKRQLVSEAFQEKSKRGKANDTRMADISRLLGSGSIDNAAGPSKNTTAPVGNDMTSATEATNAGP